jgi:hypothetical protein
MSNSNMPLMKEITVVGEYGEVLVTQNIYTSDPILLIQNRISTQLPYAVTLYDSDIDKCPLTTWDSMPSVVVAREYKPTSPVWRGIMELGKDKQTNPLYKGTQQFIVSVVNSHTMNVVSTDLMGASDGKLLFSVKPMECEDEYGGWNVSIPEYRFDIMDSISGDLSVSRSERLYLELIVAVPPSTDDLFEQEQFVTKCVFDNDLMDYLYTFLVVKGMNGEVYFSNTW